LALAFFSLLSSTPLSPPLHARSRAGMASAQVIPRRAEDVHSDTRISNLFQSMYIAQPESQRWRGVATAPAPAPGQQSPHALPQHVFAQATRQVSQQGPSVPPSNPTATVEAELCSGFEAAWPSSSAGLQEHTPQSCQPGAHALSSTSPPPVQPGVARPRSPDSRYLTTDWAAHDEVEEELSFMLADQAAITNDGFSMGGHHELSYIS